MLHSQSVMALMPTIGSVNKVIQYHVFSLLWIYEHVIQTKPRLRTTYGWTGSWWTKGIWINTGPSGRLTTSIWPLRKSGPVEFRGMMLWVWSRKHLTPPPLKLGNELSNQILDPVSQCERSHKRPHCLTRSWSGEGFRLTLRRVVSSENMLSQNRAIFWWKWIAFIKTSYWSWLGEKSNVPLMSQRWTKAFLCLRVFWWKLPAFIKFHHCVARCCILMDLMNIFNVNGCAVLTFSLICDGCWWLSSKLSPGIPWSGKTFFDDIRFTFTNTASSKHFSGFAISPVISWLGKTFLLMASSFLSPEQLRQNIFLTDVDAVQQN